MAGIITVKYTTDRHTICALPSCITHSPHLLLTRPMLVQLFKEDHADEPGVALEGENVTYEGMVVLSGVVVLT